MVNSRTIRVSIDCTETRCANCTYRVDNTTDTNGPLPVLEHECPIWGQPLEYDSTGAPIRLEVCRWADTEPLGRPTPQTPTLNELEELAATLRTAMDEVKPYVVNGPIGTGRRLAMALIEAGYRKEPPPPAKTKPPPPTTPSPIPAIPPLPAPPAPPRVAVPSPAPQPAASSLPAPVGWVAVGDDTAFAEPFGTIRVCRVCGCLVAGGPTACVRCALQGDKP